MKPLIANEITDLEKIARHARWMASDCGNTPNTPNDLPNLFYFTHDTPNETSLNEKTISAINCLPKGAGIIFRHYAVQNREHFAQEVASLCRAKKLYLYVAGNAHLAQRTRANGVHLPEFAISQAIRIHRQFPALQITAAIHSFPSFLRSITLPINAYFLSPIFPTSSHSNANPLRSTRFSYFKTQMDQQFREVGQDPRPVFALGGINATNCSQLRKAGASGIAGISLFEN